MGQTWLNIPSGVIAVRDCLQMGLNAYNKSLAKRYPNSGGLPGFETRLSGADTGAVSSHASTPAVGRSPDHPTNKPMPPMPPGLTPWIPFSRCTSAAR
ncbi:hypothetical protein AB0F07_40375 [Streptomyces fructofermentans]|uniref:hypothetical protein n=1 Tax=Streptomyces fructofermentans TaxID=152141 RepID=UPI00340A554A